MSKLKQYKCMKCGTCCFEIEGCPGIKRIPLYPSEVDKLIEISKEMNINFQVVEDLFFPDILNQKILILTYKILLDNKNKCCPFYELNIGCMIHNSKPLACQAYPLSLKRIDAFNFEIAIDPSCNWILSNYNLLSSADLNKIKEIFKDEYPNAEKFYHKNKKLQFKIRKLEYEKKIEIPHEISFSDLNEYLREWERDEIY